MFLSVQHGAAPQVVLPTAAALPRLPQEVQKEGRGPVRLGHIECLASQAASPIGKGRPHAGGGFCFTGKLAQLVAVGWELNVVAWLLDVVGWKLDVVDWLVPQAEARR